jgi:hypothetical protein
MRVCRGHHVEAHLHLPGHQVGQHRGPPAIRHMHQIDVGHCLEQLACNVRRRARAERGDGDLARIGFRVADELGHGLGWHGGIGDHHQRKIDQSGHRRDIAR